MLVDAGINNQVINNGQENFNCWHFDHVAIFSAICKFNATLMGPADTISPQVLLSVIIFAATYNLCSLVHHGMFRTADNMLN